MKLLVLFLFTLVSSLATANDNAFCKIKKHDGTDDETIVFRKLVQDTIKMAKSKILSFRHENGKISFEAHELNSPNTQANFTTQKPGLGVNIYRLSEGNLEEKITVICHNSTIAKIAEGEALARTISLTPGNTNPDQSSLDPNSKIVSESLFPGDPFGKNLYDQDGRPYGQGEIQIQHAQGTN